MMPEERPRAIVRIMDRLNIGGPALQAILLSCRMGGTNGLPSAFPWRTVLVTGSEEPGEGSLIKSAVARGVHPEIVPSMGRELRPWRDLRALWEIYKIVRRERPQIVHTHKSKAGALGRIAARLAGVPIVIHTFHGHAFHGYFSPMRAAIFRLIETFLALWTDCILAVSQRVKDDLVAYGIAPSNKIEVVRLGFDLRRFASSERGHGGIRSELGIPADAPLIGIVARLVPIKGIPVFLRAAALILRARPNARFLLAGDGELRGELEALAKELGLEGSVRFLGFRDDLQRIYADLDVLCLSSFNEGSPVSLIEGLACACPVVASRVGGVPDVVRDGETGMLVPAGDAAALAAAVLGLLADPLRGRRLAEAGRRDVLAWFTAERLASDLDSLYRRLLARSS